ncbi:hypothetical protein KAR91_54725 [Candidatus Pacearchaeota archaeon]|nr:hypothetical protein [Candidatus Pacearchaeota archaeon]
MKFIDVDTAVELEVNVAQLIDSSDFVTQEAAISYNAAGMALFWHFQTTAGVIAAPVAVTPTTAGDYDWTHSGGAIYKIEMPASGGASANNDTEGFGRFSGVCDGVLSWIGPIYCFRAAETNNAMINGSGFISAMLNTVVDNTYNIAKSWGKRLRGIEEYQGYEGGSIYINTTGGGSAGSESHVNGILDNPVDNLADALILSAALNITCFDVSSGSSLTFISSQDGKCYMGNNWILAFGGQSINGIYIHGAKVSGIATAITTEPKLEDCTINGSTLPPGHYHGCGLLSDVVAGAAGDYFFTACESDIAGGGYPSFDFGAAIGTVNANFREYRGEIEFKNMGQAGTDAASIDGNGRVKMNANSIGGTISVQGHQELINRAAFIAAGGTVNDASRFATDQLAGLVALLEGIDTSVESAARFTEIKGAGWTTETLRAIQLAIAAVSGLDGANDVTIQLYETGGTTPIADASISIYNSAQTLLLGTVLTDVDGKIELGLDDGTYKLVCRKVQTMFTVPETIVVTQNETFIKYGVAQTYPSPSNPEACNVYCDLSDFGQAAKEGVVFSAVLANLPQVIGAVFIDDEKLSDTTDGAGRAVLTLPQGAEFIVSSEAFGKRNRTIRIDTTGESSIVLASKA